VGRLAPAGTDSLHGPQPGAGDVQAASNNFLLEQVKSDAGSAASLIMFTYFVGGATAMWFIALPWSNKVLTLALVGVASSALVLALLPRLGRARGDSL